MALYTICATDRTHSARPCAMIAAPSDAAAARTATRMRHAGELGFLPDDAQISVRRASRQEIRALHDFMPVQPDRGPADPDGGLARRGRRMRAAFNEKLWRGEIPEAAVTGKPAAEG
jgi:hypothetical protein